MKIEFRAGENVKSEAGQIRVAISVRWWVRPYIAALRLFAQSFGLEVDSQRVCDFIAKYGVVVRSKV